VIAAILLIIVAVVIMLVVLNVLVVVIATILGVKPADTGISVLWLFLFDRQNR
jgi:hypothetical protein